MNLLSFSVSLGWPEKEVLARLRELKLADPCRRCGGRGHVGVEYTPDTVCFKCQGKGAELPKLTLALARVVAQRVVRGDLDLYLERRKRRHEAARALPLTVARCRALIPPGDAATARELSDIIVAVATDKMDPETGHVMLSALHARLTRAAEPVSCQAAGGTK